MSSAQRDAKERFGVGGVGSASNIFPKESWRKGAGWSRVGLFNGSLVENIYLNGGRRRADSASGHRRNGC